jgi:hypothetical protein
MTVPDDNRTMVITGFDPAVYKAPIDYLNEKTQSINTHDINAAPLS